MAKLSVIYEFHESGICPMLILIRFARNELNWSRSAVYIPLEAPFQRLQPEDLDESEPGLTIQLEDLIVNSRYPHCFGIDLQSIFHRYQNSDFSFIQEIRQFYVPIALIEEALQLDARSYYIS